MKKSLKQRIADSGRSLLFLLALGLFSIGVHAQELTVTGQVISTEDGLPIPGVSIVIKGTTNGTITDLDGNYAIQAKVGDVLQLNFVGMKDVDITVSKAVHDIKMDPEIFGLDEVVAIGYGTQKKKEVSGAVVQVKSEALTQMATADLGTALQGQVAGVNVQASSGSPGAASNIQIRGLSSINGTNAPLFVVDGIPQTGDPRLSNNEIETIDILKDAASSAIYGTRGSGGVILITTKRGKAGTMKISVDSYAGIQKITSGIPLMNFEEYFYNYYTNSIANNGTHMDNTWTPLETNANDMTNNTNIMNVVQNDNAFVQNHSVNISGGKEDLTFSLVGSYFEQEGMLINSGYDRFNVRSNTNYKKGRWDITMGLGTRVETREREPWNLLYDAYKYKPYQQPIDPNQNSADETGGENETIQLGNMMYKFLQRDNENTEEFNGNLQVKFNILKGFDFVTRLGTRYSNSTRTIVNPPIKLYDEDGHEIIRSQFRSKVRNESRRASNFTWESALNYTKTFNGHKITALAMMSTEKYTNTMFWGQGMDLFSSEITVLNGTTADWNAGSGTNWNMDRTNTLVGMLGRLQYDYKGKYIFSGSVRRDGSSRFAPENRWGIFPSASAAWNIADEAFWSSLQNVANSFKLRGSVGTTGNQNFLDYQYAPTIGIGYDYPFGSEGTGGLKLGAIQTGYANPFVKWETTIQSNIGLDMGFFSNRLTFTADFYNSDKEDMLFPLLLPTSTGAGRGQSVILNVGNMNNKGMEFAIGWRQAGKVTWSVNGTFSRNVNKITKMSGSTDISYFQDGWAVNISGNNDRITAIKEGYEAGAFFLIPTEGLANTEEKLAEYQKIDPAARLGDLMYVDVNGDGDINDDDRVYSGSGMPDYELGLNANVDWNGIDLSMIWYASVGNEIINGGRIFAMDAGTHKDVLYQWSPVNPYGVIPSQRSGSHNKRSRSDLWVEDGSFVRLRNITLGYTLPRHFTQRAGIGKLRFYIAADNPLTLTKYQGYDPEVGGNGLATRGLDRGNYPISSQYRAGLQLDF